MQQGHAHALPTMLTAMGLAPRQHQAAATCSISCRARTNRVAKLAWRQHDVMCIQQDHSAGPFSAAATVYQAGHCTQCQASRAFGSIARSWKHS